ncbi:PREDICTED: serine/threonine-protein phosphatase 4 regulatory subunit 2-A [Tarenaya hassleriana]|uniref:serine/threonine-protein phosphatase 4 regulatory subunit 2-A n=1 Tax=Tarenaya hassleriana TaxID=28532 RepID=UPI00053C8F31|nr:PREDICTED: serine/threonine-protein phosphatase 4 regulatory subunit 2-A [Tarenaya hassleriana]
MATTSTTKGRPDRQSSLTRSRSLGRKPKPPGSSEHNSTPDGSDHKPDKPLPNYLKPTISSRPDPVKFLKKGLDDNHKLLRRRSFDHPPSFSSPTTASTSSPRDRPSVSRDSHKPITGRSSSFHGSKTGPRGGGSMKSPPVAPGPKGIMQSGLSTSSSSFHSKKEGSSLIDSKKTSEKEIARESPHEEEQEIVKVETDAGVVSDYDREEPKSEDKEEQSNESSEEKKGSDQTDASPVLDCPDATKEEGEEIHEDKAVEQIEETKAPEETLDNEDEHKMEESSGEVAATDVKEAASLKESTEEEKANDTEQENETESSNVKEETSETKEVVAESPEATKRQVVQGKKESPSAYNDVIEKTASKLLENRKNKVKALVGAFETVIDYETAASK